MPFDLSNNPRCPMIRVLCVSLLAFASFQAVAPLPARAAGAPAKKEEARDATFDMPGVVAPITRNGKLVNYIFLNIRLEFFPNAPVIKLRERAHFMRDALILALYKTDISQPNHPGKIDEPRASALILGIIEAQEGKGLIKSVTFNSADSLSSFRK